MATTRAFAHNPSQLTIPGTINVGTICIGVEALNYGAKPGGLTWWMGPDEDNSYLIAKDVPSGNFPTPLGNIGTLQFWRCADNDSAFTNLVSILSGTAIAGVDAADSWLSLNGYWTSKAVTLIIDSDAGAFITAANITELTQKSAINNLVIGLKDDNIWSKFKAIYPFVGGTASSHKFNLRDPRDSNDAYRLNFNGGWTHDARGIKGNGINTYADTFYTGFLNMMGAYSPDENGLVAYGYNQYGEGYDEEYGGYTTQEQRGSLFSSYAQFTCCSWDLSSSGYYGEGLAQIGGSFGAKNGVKISDAHSGFNVIDLPLGGVRELYYNTNRTIVSNSVGSGGSTAIQSFSYFSNVVLTIAESAKLYTRVQAFQTALGRQIANIPTSDEDVFKFLNRLRITNTQTSLTQITAINNLVVDLKTQNLWTKMRDIYPFITDTRNFLNGSEQFNTGYWTRQNGTVTANSTTSPNNTLTASSFVENALTGSHSFSAPPGIALTDEQYTASIYLKKNLRDWAYIRMFNNISSNNLNGYFNLATGTIGTVDSGATATITDVGNGWYRCTLTRTMSSSLADNFTIGAAIADNTSSYTGNGGTAMFIWGAQLELGSSATTYQLISSTSSNKIQGHFYANLKESISAQYGGGWTFSPKGAKGNGVNAYFQIYRDYNTSFTAGNLHISTYSKIGVIPNRNMSLWGGSASFAPYYGSINQATFSDAFNMKVSLGYSDPSAPMNNTKGLIMTSVTSASGQNFKTYQNGVLKFTTFGGSPIVPSLAFNAFIDNYTYRNYAPFEISFITTGTGLTEAEAAIFNTIVTNYQTALSRQIDSNLPPVNINTPLLTGTALVGQALTSSTGDWTSSNSIASFNYQWRRNGINISGSTTSTYVLTTQDYPLNITCTVTAINIDGKSVPAISNSLLVNQAATNTFAPEISGTQTVGSTLSSSTGNWTGNATITFAYQWKKNGSNIVGATSSTYVLVTGDAGASTTIQCVVTGTNAYGSSNGNSNILTNIAPEYPANISTPVISGTQRVGSTLTSTTGNWTGAGTITYNYQWKKNGSNIVGATSSTYVLISADSGSSTTIQCVVTATNSFGNASANSNILTGIIAEYPVNTLAPVIGGNPRVAQTLTIGVGSWTGNPTITFTYQWKKNGSNIGGATSQSYTLVAGDLGAGTTIQCAVTGTNSFGNATANSNIITGVGSALPVVSDANAQAFINRADISNTTQATAINNLVVGMKADGIWGKMGILYPFVGGTAASHSYNLIDPANYTLTFYGGWIHSSTGAKPNGVNGYAETGYMDSNYGDKPHRSVYSRENINNTGYDMAVSYGYSDGESGNVFFNSLQIGTTYFQNQLGDSYTYGGWYGSSTDALGLFTVSRDSTGLGGDNTVSYKRGVAISTVNTYSAPYYRNGPAYKPLTLSAMHSYYDDPYGSSDSVGGYNNRQQSFVSYGAALTATEVANYNTRVQAFQTALTRQV
jgi:hypothetical protein